MLIKATGIHCSLDGLQLLVRETRVNQSEREMLVVSVKLELSSLL